MGLHKTHTRWLVRSWSTFGAKMNHGQHIHTRFTTAELGGSHHLPPYSILCTSPRGPHPNGFLSWDSQVRVSKSRQLGLPRLWSPITLRADLGLRCGLKQNYSSCRELSNGMLHAVFKQVNWVESRLFLVGSQSGSLTPGPSFGHNLCFWCLNYQWEPILDIHVSRNFQWYKERHKTLSFDPWNCSLKFWKSTGTPSPKVGVALGVWFTPSYSLTLSYTPGSMWCDSWASSWPATLQPLCLGRKPKARVVTVKLFQFNRLYILVGLKNDILLHYKWPLISTLVAPLSFLQPTSRKHGCREQFIAKNSSSRDEAAGKEDALLITLHLIIIQRIGVSPISFIITLSDRPWLLQIAKHN